MTIIKKQALINFGKGVEKLKQYIAGEKIEW